MDAFLFRMLFAVGGAASGAALAGSLPVVFRLRHVSRAGLALSLLVGASSFGALLFLLTGIPGSARRPSS